MLVPGAIAALEALAKKYGRLSFASSIEPSIKLAEQGFKLNSVYAKLIQYGYPNQVLKKTKYGRDTYFPNGNALKEGEILKLPVVATFLKRLRGDGASYMYKGEWSKKYVTLAKSLGGKITLGDLESYSPQWLKPLKVTYRNHDVYNISGPSFGSIWTLLSLKVYENWNPGPIHFSKSTTELEKIVRVSREVSKEPWIYKLSEMNNYEKVLSKINDEKYSRNIWKRVNRKNAEADNDFERGTHSYHIVVIDDYGNAITGTNTINSYPWGDGYFVEGIPIHNSGKIADDLYYGEVGGRRVNPHSMSLVFKNNKLKFATGNFSGGLLESSFQFLVNLIDYKLNAYDATHLPRFGGIVPGSRPIRNYLSKRISDRIVSNLKRRGIFFERSVPWIDTGLGIVGIINKDGSIEGDFAPIIGY